MGVREEVLGGISNISTIGTRNDLCTSLRNTTTVLMGAKMWTGTESEDKRSILIIIYAETRVPNSFIWFDR